MYQNLNYLPQYWTSASAQLVSQPSFNLSFNNFQAIQNQQNLQNLQLSQKNLYYGPNRSYEINSRNNPQSNFYANYYTNLNQYHQLPLSTPDMQNSNLLPQYINLKDQKSIFKSNASFDTETEDVSNEDEEEFGDNDSEYTIGLIDLERLLTRKNLSKDDFKKLERNQRCLSALVEGDLIEFVESEADLEERENLRKWAVYMGNSMIMRFDIKLKTIVYESYWKIAQKNFVFINRDLDKRLMTLPIYETLDKARNAYSNKQKQSEVFSSDRNFALWCRFDVNRSDIDFATDFSKGNDTYSAKDAKEFLLNKFLNSFEQKKSKKITSLA